MLKEYLTAIFKTAQKGDATEPSYYHALKDLFEAFATSSGKTKVQVTALPKKTEAGNPDFRVWDGKQHIVGYIEAKDPHIENLEVVETSDQLKRYLHTFPNLILTNFFQFRLYRNGELVGSVQIARPFTLYKLKSIPILKDVFGQSDGFASPSVRVLDPAAGTCTFPVASIDLLTRDGSSITRTPSISDGPK